MLGRVAFVFALNLYGFGTFCLKNLSGALGASGCLLRAFWVSPGSLLGSPGCLLGVSLCLLVSPGCLQMIPDASR